MVDGRDTQEREKATSEESDDGWASSSSTALPVSGLHPRSSHNNDLPSAMADPTPPPPSASAPFEFTFRSQPPRSTDPRLSQRRAFLPPPDDNGRRRIRPTDGGGDDDRMDGPSALSSAVAPTIKRGWGWGLGLGTDEEQLSRGVLARGQHKPRKRLADAHLSIDILQMRSSLRPNDGAVWRALWSMEHASVRKPVSRSRERKGRDETSSR